MPRFRPLRSTAILSLLAGGTTVRAARVDSLILPGTLPFQASRFDPMTVADDQPAFALGAAGRISGTTRIANALATADAK